MPLAREQRKLAAILAADVVGYSRLMGRDGSGTLARLREQPLLYRAACRGSDERCRHRPLPAGGKDVIAPFPEPPPCWLTNADDIFGNNGA